MRVSSITMMTLVIMATVTMVAAASNDQPVIGVFDQPQNGVTGPSYLAASYVKYLESAGARVVPLHYRDTSSNLRSLVSKLNGVFFTGGGTDLEPGRQYFEAAQVVYSEAVAANARGDYFPLWGTCMGFQLLCILGANDTNILAGNKFDSYNYPIPIDATPLLATSRMFSSAYVAHDVYQAALTQNITMNNHHDGVLLDSWAKSNRLTSMYNVLSTNVDRKGLGFISTIEGIKVPFYGVQWHPEKNPFEWTPNEALPHTAIAVRLAQAMANFFVDETRKSSHSFTSAELQPLLIYNYSPEFTGAQGSDFTQQYKWT